jgi:hypothetical protein
MVRAPWSHKYSKTLTDMRKDKFYGNAKKCPLVPKSMCHDPSGVNMYSTGVIESYIFPVLPMEAMLTLRSKSQVTLCQQNTLKYPIKVLSCVSEDVDNNFDIDNKSFPHTSAEVVLTLRRIACLQAWV